MQRLGVGGVTETHSDHHHQGKRANRQGPAPLTAPNSSSDTWDTVSSSQATVLGSGGVLRACPGT